MQCVFRFYLRREKNAIFILDGNDLFFIKLLNTLDNNLIFSLFREKILLEIVRKYGQILIDKELSLLSTRKISSFLRNTIVYAI